MCSSWLCVLLKFEHGFQWVKFVSNFKVGSSLTVNAFALYCTLHAIGPVVCECLQCNIVEVGLETLQKEQKL